MSKTTNSTRYSRYKSYARETLYHVYNRGNGKQNIFLEDADYKFYLNRLERYLKKHKVSLICYILMPNHLHLVIKQETDVPIYKFISSLHTSYSMYFNKKYNHTGHLFQDRFKQVIIESDEQLLYLTRYIHQNPIKAGLTNSIDAYFWTSYHEFVGNIPQPLCEKNIIVELLTSNEHLFPKTYAEFCKIPTDLENEEMLKEIAIETL